MQLHALSAALLLAMSTWGPRGAPDRPAGQDPILVFAAASTREVLDSLADQWRDSGGDEVVFSFDATSRLAAQIKGGAPADAFVSADPTWTEWLRGDGLLTGTAARFARNRLVVLMTPGVEAIQALEDLQSLEGAVALAGDNVPAGRYAQAALESAGVWSGLGTVVRGGSVRSVLEWVAQGEVDAALVYWTDALIAPDLEVAFEVPEGLAPLIDYWAAPTSTDPRGQAFVDFITSPEASALVQAFGFRSATEGGTTAAPPATNAAQDPRAQGSRPPSVNRAILLSLFVALLATLLATPAAVGMGWLLARFDFPGKALVTTVVMTPLVLPPVVTGFLLLSLLGRNGWLGGTLEAFGVSVPFTLLGATAAALVVGFPLYMMSARSAFEAVDRRYAEVAWTLGDKPTGSFWRVSLPMALPGVLAGAVLAFARALGEFGATIVLAGNIEGRTRTIPLAVYTALETPGGGRVAWLLVGASVGIAALALLGFESLSRAQRRKTGEGRS